MDVGKQDFYPDQPKCIYTQGDNNERIGRHLRDTWRTLKNIELSEQQRDLAYFHDMGQVDKLNVFSNDDVNASQ